MISLSPSLNLSLLLRITLTHSHSLNLPLSLILTHTHSHSHSLSLPHSLLLSHSHSQYATLWYIASYSLSLTVSVPSEESHHALSYTPLSYSRAVSLILFSCYLAHVSVFLPAQNVNSSKELAGLTN